MRAAAARALQRTAGNRAVAHLLQRAASEARRQGDAGGARTDGPKTATLAGIQREGRAVQRYTVEGDFQVSQSRVLGIASGAGQKQFFATEEALARSNRILEGMNSPVELSGEGHAPEPLQNLQVVTPQARQGGPLFDSSECIDVADRVTNSGQTHAVYRPDEDQAQTTLRGQRAYALGEINEIAGSVAESADVTPEQIVQAQDENGENEDMPTYQFRCGDTEVSTSNWQEALTALTPIVRDVNLRRALLKVINVELARKPRAQQRLIDQVYRELNVPEVPEVLEVAAQAVDGWQVRVRAALSASRTAQSTAYEELAPDAAEARSRRLGINRHARPDVGESFGIFSTRDRQQGAGLWSFHFAAVIARDGPDSVTLENFNREGAENGADQWYFSMQGPAEQSFHNLHKDTVAGALTLRMGQEATDDLRQSFRQRIADKTHVAVDALPADILSRIAAAKTRAELAAIYADAAV